MYNLKGGEIMADIKRKKAVQTITLSPDVHDLLRKRASSAGVSMSVYIERLILKDDWASPLSESRESDMSKLEDRLNDIYDFDIRRKQ